MKNGLRTAFGIVLACGVGVETGERAEIYKGEAREIGKQLQVRLGYSLM